MGAGNKHLKLKSQTATGVNYEYEICQFYLIIQCVPFTFCNAA